jgi:plastocyanin
MVQGTDATGTGDPSTYYWTVSPRTVSITDAGFDPQSLASVTRGSLVQWTNNGSNQHTVTDASAMGLFDSGPIGPGQTFTQMFIAGGVFSYTSTLDPGSSGEVKVPVGISPTTVQKGQPYTVTWAAQPAPADFVFDVQYKDPDDASWVDWKTDVTNLNATVTTNANTMPGKWLYRARIQRVSSGATSAWSSSSGVTVAAGDVTAPVTTITGGPTSPTTDKTATFTYVANEPATFQCAIDGGAFTSCPPSGKTYSNLAKGTHNFGVRATDNAGNVGDPDTYSWYVSKVVTASITDAGFDVATLNVGMGATVRWTNNGTAPHTVTDSSAVALFDSGPILPGGTFEFFFDGASTYNVTSTLDTGFAQAVQVKPTVSPTTGTVTTPFTITFAAIPPPPTLLFDVLVKRPGVQVYQLLFLGETDTSAVFVPDRGTGVYSFVVYARNLANDTEAISPKVSITVS